MGFETMQLAGYTSPAPAIKERMLSRAGKMTGFETPRELAFAARQEAQDQMALIAADKRHKALEAMAQGAEEKNNRKPRSTYALMG